MPIFSLGEDQFQKEIPEEIWAKVVYPSLMPQNPDYPKKKRGNF